MTKKVIVFAGTTEGRLLCEFLEDMQIESKIYVPDKPGEDFLDYMEKNTSFQDIDVGHFNKDDLQRIMSEAGSAMVIDATSSSEAKLKTMLKEVCREKGMEYYRMVRKTKPLDDVISMPNTEILVSYLNNCTGNILLAVNEKYFGDFAGITDYRERVYVRVPAKKEIIAQCNEQGLDAGHIIGLGGDLSEDMICALLKEYQIHYLVTRDTEDYQAFEHKRVSAKRAGTEVVVIARPKEESGYTLEEIRELFV